MKVRKFLKGDEQDLWELFYNTVHTINSHDYNQAQIDSWAPSDFDINIAIEKFRELNPFVVTKNGKIVGYADIQSDGYIDHFVVIMNFKGRGLGNYYLEYLKKKPKRMVFHKCIQM